MGSEEVSIP